MRLVDGIKRESICGPLKTHLGAPGIRCYGLLERSVAAKSISSDVAGDREIQWRSAFGAELCGFVMIRLDAYLQLLERKGRGHVDYE